MTDLAELLERVNRLRSYSNDIDIDIDIALFEPDSQYRSVKPNAAKTKLVFTLADGTTRTHWADDHTLTGESRDRAARRLSAIIAKGADK